MAVTIRIPTPLRRWTQGSDRVDASGKTVAEVLEDLERNHSGIREKLCDESGKVRRFVNIYVNGQDIRFAESLQTEVHEGDEVSIVPAIAGGLGRS